MLLSVTRKINRLSAGIFIQKFSYGRPELRKCNVRASSPNIAPPIVLPRKYEHHSWQLTTYQALPAKVAYLSLEAHAFKSLARTRLTDGSRLSNSPFFHVKEPCMVWRTRYEVESYRSKKDFWKALNQKDETPIAERRVTTRDSVGERPGECGCERSR